MTAFEACKALIGELRQEGNRYAGSLERALNAYEGDVEKACIYVEVCIARAWMEDQAYRDEDGNRAHGCSADPSEKEERERSQASRKIRSLRRSCFPESELPLAAFELRCYWSYTLPKKS